MNQKFILSCESTVDMPYSNVAARNIPVIFYSYTVDGVDYEDDMLRDPTALPRFYQMLADGKMPTTTQLNAFQYLQFFEQQLQKGDLLHICLGTGMTKSYQNAVTAAEELRQQYPHRKIMVLDSLCSSSGYGMLVDCAADLRDQGASMEEIETWVLANRKLIHHQFFSTELKHYRRSGRMSGPTAMIATILSICPIMRLDDTGKIIAYSKARGKKNAIAVTADTMLAHAQGGAAYSGKCYICHSQCMGDAQALKEAVLQRFPALHDIPIFDVGTSIASHCGPGTAAVFFFGDERAPE